MRPEAELEIEQPGRYPELMKIILPMILIMTAGLCACATQPVAPLTPASTSATVPVNIVGCSSNLLPSTVPNGDPRAALIFFGLEIGYDIGVYGTCVTGKLLQPAPAAVVSDGIYHSGRGTFTVALPTPPTTDRKPSINIVQPTVLPADYAMFWPIDGDAILKSGPIAYGAGTATQTQAQMAEPLDVEAEQEVHQNAMTTGRFGAGAPSLLRHEMVTVDGHPTVFEVYSSPLHLPDQSRDEPLYLLTYFTREAATSATLVIFWRGACAACTDGGEADVRKLDPSIGRFVDSFQLNEKMIATLKAADDGDQPTQAKQSPALPNLDIPAGKALVYFYMRSRLLGGMNFHLAEDGNELGTLTYGTYLYETLDPGVHSFTLSTHGSDDDPCRVQVDAGRTAYFEVYVSQPDAWPFHKMEISCKNVIDLDARAELATLKSAN